MPLDWDKLRIFHEVADAGSFTHAANDLHLSQSAISRQVSALEYELATKLFHRHARGLVLTEQGEMLYATAHDVLMKLVSVKNQLSESKDNPTGKLRVTTTVGLGQGWLTDKAQQFLEIYPDLDLQLIFDNSEIDINMRHADCAIRLRRPHESDLIQRRLFTVHMHIFASPEYLNHHGEPKELNDLDKHKIITFGEPAPSYITHVNWLTIAGRSSDNPRPSRLEINSLTSVMRATQNGLGISMLPDYMVDRKAGLVQILKNAEVPSFDTYFCYPPEMRESAKLKAFRDFLVSQARSWKF